MAFHTEKQIEDWLESQTRDLVMPDGTTRPHTAFKLVWHTMDSLVEVSGYSPLELVEYALEEAHLQKMSFDEAFTGVLSWLDEQRRKQWTHGSESA